MERIKSTDLEIAIRHDILARECRKIDSSQVNDKDKEAMKDQATQTLEKIKALKDELIRKDIEWEEVQNEIVRTKNREEGILKAIGSTLKDTF